MIHEPSETRYGIQELAELGGVTRRTVRYYVRRGLLPVPMGTGRGKHYTREHLDALIQIRKLQESGVALDDMGARLEAPESLAETTTEAPPQVAESEQSAWTRVIIRSGVELHIKGRYGLNSEQMARLGEAIALILDADPSQSAGSSAQGHREAGDE